MLKFVADENIPSPVVKRIREAGYDLATVPEVASAGRRNFELAELSVEIDRVVFFRYARFLPSVARSLSSRGQQHCRKSFRLAISVIR